MAYSVSHPEPDDPEHTPQERSAAAARSTWVSVLVNSGLTVGQILAGVVAHSQGLVSDGIHSASDLFADFVVLYANRHSSKDPDDDHPYGHQRFETAASLALGALLIAVALGLLSSALARISTPASIPRVGVLALSVALVALVAKEALFRYTLAVAKRVRSSMLVANAWHARSDAASSLVVAAGVLGNLGGYPILDPIAALLVAVLVGRMGWRFGWQAMRDLVDGAADAGQVEAIRATLLATNGVAGVHELRTRKMGDMIVVDAHIEVDATLSVEAGHDIAVRARLRVMQHHPVLDLMAHIDPWQRPDADHSHPGDVAPT